MGHGTPPDREGARPRAPTEPQHRRRHDRARRHVHADALPLRLRTACVAHEAAFAAGNTEEPELLTSRQVLEFATIEGARVCGLEDRTGSLTPGKQADIVVIRCDHSNTYPVIDPVSTVVHQADTRNVDTVMVAGDVLKRDGAARRRRPAPRARQRRDVARLPARSTPRSSPTGFRAHGAAGRSSLTALTNNPHPPRLSNENLGHSRPRQGGTAKVRSTRTECRAVERQPSSCSPHSAPCSSTAVGASGAAAGRSASRRREIAYLSFAVANSYDAPMLAAAKAVAEGQRRQASPSSTRPTTRRSSSPQLQTAITSKQYDGIIVQPIFGPQLIPTIKSAIKAGLKVVNIDQILGTNPGTAAPPVHGPLRQRRLRPDGDRQEAGPARRPGLRRAQGEPVQGRLPVLGEGVVARHRDPQGLRPGDRRATTSRSSPRARPSTTRRTR